jgi:outer membrane receptor for ferrienterochelin and colicins
VKKSAFIVLVCFTWRALGQNIQILSAKDSLRIPFVSLLIKSDRLNYGLTSNDQGIITLSHGFVDTVKYQVTLQGFGFEKYHRQLSGAEIRGLQTVYLALANVSLSEVVITAQYEPTVAERSVQKVKVIDKEKITQMGAVNLRDVLSNQLNVRLEQDNILGSGMSLQGISGENVKILVDGVPLIGRLNGNIDLSQINMNNVERIELVEGPLSVQYGTNALAGTINIITKKTQSKHYSASITSYYESIGTYNFTGDAGLSYKRHNLQLSGGRNYFDGWKSSELPFTFPKSRLADSLRYQQWKPKEQFFASAAYQYSFKKLDLGLKSAWFDETILNRGYPRLPYGETTFDDYYKTLRLDNSLSLKGRLGSNWSVNALGAYNYYRRIKKTVYKDLTTLNETLSGPSDQDTSSFTLAMSRASFIYAKPGSKFNYELGYDVSYESALGKRIDKQLQYMGDYAAFITTEYKPVEALVIKPGLRYAYNTVYKTPLVPSLNVKWAVTDNHVLRASYAKGFRAPSIKELYFLFVDINHNIIGNQDLRAEQSDNFSLSYNYNRDMKKCRLRFDLSGFYNDIFNLITLAQVNSLEYSYVNVGRYKTTGMQLGGSLNFRRLFVQAGFNYTGRYNQLSEGHDVPGFAYTPEVLANASYKLLKQKTTFSVFYKHTGRLPGYALSGEDVVQTTVASYSMMDATVSQLFWQERIALTLGCKNVLDITNISSTMVSAGAHSSSTTSMPLATGRNYFIKLAFNISKG